MRGYETRGGARGSVGTRGRRSAGAVLLVAAVVSACSSPGSGAPAGGAGPRVSTSPAAPAATKALDASAVQLRAQVEQLATPLKGGAVPTTWSGQTYPYLRMNNAGPCDIAAGTPWPQRWGYGVMLLLKQSDPVSAADTLRKGLVGAGWTIVRTYDTTVDSLDFDARKGGMVLEIAGEPNPSLIRIDGYGPCIGADGRPVA